MDVELPVETSVDPPAVEPAEAPAPPEVPDIPNPLLDRYNEIWKEVTASPNDFNTWSNLIAAAERLDELDKIGIVYDAFLASWPLCYGYWKKYADAEHRHGSFERAIAVYERGVAATPYSTDIWMHFSNFQKTVPEVTPDTLRSIFERALAAVGTDYLSHAIWDKYIAFEQEQGNKTAVIALYSRVLGVPIRDLDKYYHGIRNMLHETQLQDLMTVEEIAVIKSQLEAERKEAAANAAAAAAAQEEASKKAVEPAKEEVAAVVDSSVGDEKAADAEMPDAGSDATVAAEAPTVAPTEVPTEVPAEVPPVSGSVVQADIPVTEEDIKARWMVPRDMMYAASHAELENRRLFEESIKRSYFHVKALDSQQLTNWLKYLDYVEGKGDSTATMILYERCLVACANYPEFWERYVRWLEQQGYLEEAMAALQRATLTFCRNRPDMHLFAMHFDERRGLVDSARARYKLILEQLAPRLLSATVAAANFERRQGNRESACEVFESLMKEETSREDSISKGTIAFLAMQYAHFLRVAYNDIDKGRKVLHDALESSPHMKQLWEAAIFFEEVAKADDMVSRVMDLCARASSSSGTQTETGVPMGALSDKDREDFSLRAVDFADAHGTVQDLLLAEQRHAASFLLPANVASEGRKRHAEAAAAEAAARPTKAARTDVGMANASHAAAGYYGHAQAAAAYPGYPPTAQYPAAAYAGYPGYSAQQYGYAGYGYGY